MVEFVTKTWISGTCLKTCTHVKWFELESYIIMNCIIHNGALKRHLTSILGSGAFPRGQFPCLYSFCVSELGTDTIIQINKAKVSAVRNIVMGLQASQFK